MTGLAPLRPHQAESLARLRRALADGSRRPILQASTGFGKTIVAAHIVAGCRARGKRVVFTVPTLGLIDQTFERFVENGIDASEIGVMQGDHPWRRPHAPIQIATLQTLDRRELPIVDVVVIDEAHIQHKVIERWMSERPEVIFIGLSATPWARGLGRRFDRLVKSISLSELIGQGYLSPFRVFAPSKPDLTGVKVQAGDFHEGQLAERMNKPQLVADVVITWLQRAEDRPTICFATGRKHARAIHERFAEFDVPSAYVDADTPREEREQIGRRLAAGSIKVAVNIGTLTTGIDWDVRCLILARPTKSESLFVQMVGRGLRTAHGKTDCLILDHSDTHARLGFVTDIDHDDLDDGKRIPSQRARRERKTALPKCCPSCLGVVRSEDRECSSCGHRWPLVAPVDVRSGDLVEFNGRAPAQGKRQAIADRPKRDVYAELLTIQIERDRSEGWVAHTFRSIYGVWPRGMVGVLPRPASSEVRDFVKHKDIVWAKSRKPAEVSHGAAR